ncbi:MAG TPA: endonuclease/exonuclease/phosphatase family protein [Burkholderiaceae bacterium]
MKTLLRLYVAGVFALAVLQSVAYAVPSLASWWVELLHYVPYPAYLGPALLALPISLLLGRLWRWAALIAVALVLVPVMGLATGRADAGQGHLRMMTYNIKAYLASGRPDGWALLEDEIKRQDPDILVMQDAGELAHVHARHPNVAAGIFAGRQVYASGQYIVVSRFPLKDCAAGDLSYRDQLATHVHCVVRVGDQDIDLLTAHLNSPRAGLNATRYEQVDGLDDWQQNFGDRLEQSQKLAEAIGQLKGQQRRPMIVAGDLNAAESSPVVRRLLDRGLRDAYSSSSWGYGYTLGHALRMRMSFLRIDHILVSPELGVEKAYAGGGQASEHRPVIADLWLHRAQ